MKKILYTLSLSILFSPISLYAQELELPEHATMVFNHLINMKPPTNDLERWERDMWSFSAISCYRGAKIPLPESLSKSKPYSTGTFRLPNNIASYCQNLSGGPQLQCFNLNSTISPFGMPLPGLPSNYIYIEKGQKVKNNTEIMVGGYCYLSKNSTNKDKQFFAGKGTFQWSKEPSPTTINTVSGSQKLMVGNATITVPGLSNNFPLLVIAK